MIHRIKMAGPEEMVYIHLNTPGGHLDTGVQIVNAIQSSQAHIVCSVEAESHSLGTLIFLAADEFIVHDNCMMMFHNFSGGVYGKGHEQKAQLDATIQWFTDLARKFKVIWLDRLIVILFVAEVIAGLTTIEPMMLIEYRAGDFFDMALPYFAV